MNRWLKNILQTIIALMALLWAITGDKGDSGQQAIARGWDFISGNISVVLAGYPISDLIWFFVFQIGGWVGILVALGLFALFFVINLIMFEDFFNLPIGSLSLLLFGFCAYISPGPFPFLFICLILFMKVHESNNLCFVFYFYIFWILSAPFGWFVLFLFLINGGFICNEKRILIWLVLFGVVWDCFRIFPFFNFFDCFTDCFSVWGLGLAGILGIRVLFFRICPNKNTFHFLLTSASNIVVLIIMVSIFGSNLLANQINGFFPQIGQLRSFAELSQAKGDLVSLPLATHSQWVWVGCRVTAGLRHCLLISKPDGVKPGTLLIGDSDPRKSAANLVLECRRNTNLIPQIFSGTLCLLDETKPTTTSRNLSGLGVWRSAEAVMAFAWFEALQNRPYGVIEDSTFALGRARSWAQMAINQNSRDGLAWAITGELILAQNFLGAGKSLVTPMEIDFWLAEAAFCFRRSLDLAPLDRKTSRVFAGLLRQKGALDLAETITESINKETNLQEQSGEGFFLEQGTARIMDLKHLLEYRFPGEIDRSLDRIRYAVTLGLKGQALGELGRGGEERFGIDGAKLRLDLLLQAGFADLALELANLHANRGVDLGLMEWMRPGGGGGLGATWKLPTIPWIQCVSRLSIQPFKGKTNAFDSLRKSLSEDQSRIQNRVLKDLPLILAKNVLQLPGSPLALRIEVGMEYSSRENLLQLGESIGEEIKVLDRLERESTGQ